MPSRSGPQNPTTWDEYPRRPSPSGSFGSSVAVEEEAVIDDDAGAEAPLFGGQQRRRSSINHRLATMADLGGVNSIRSFARSWQRAAAFPEVIPRRPSFVFAAEPGSSSDALVPPPHGDIHYSRSPIETRRPVAESSLLRQHLESSPPYAAHGSERRSAGEPSNGAADTHEADNYKDRESKALDTEMASGALLQPTSSTRSSIFAAPPHLSSPPVIGSYGSYRSSHYGTFGGGTLRSRVSISSFGRDQAPDQVLEDEMDDDEDAAHGEHAPILVKEVKQGDRVILTVEGQSTMPQSVFNSINAIIGVGLLSLPLAFKMTGWIFGLVILTFTAVVTGYTAGLLARCMDYDPSLITYSDLAYVSFGSRARIVVSALFSLELLAACVALMILFADSLAILLPGSLSVNAWKCVCALLVLMLNALPLRWLSYTSVIGIFSTFCIVCIVIIDGLVKPHAPGSLWEPAQTYWLPSNWLALPLAYGLLASPWGAHSVFPSIYRDMRHPHKWAPAVKITFSFSYVLDTCLAIIGILMFGDGISDAITSNILKTAGYPEALAILLCIVVAIIPLTKIPLNARPLITTADVLCGIHQQQQQQQHHHGHHINSSTSLPGTAGGSTAAARRAALIASAIRAAIRFFVVFILLVISIAFPAFDSVCAFLGAALCTLISIILPICFYLKLYGRDVTVRERTLMYFLLVIFSILGSVGTIWTFLPKSLVGA